MDMTRALWRVQVDGTARLATGTISDGPKFLLPHDATLSTLLRGDADTFCLPFTARDLQPVPTASTWLAPVDEQEIWAAGVTYERSREARREESQVPDLYERVYAARRPELFFKSSGRRARGCGQAIGIR